MTVRFCSIEPWTTLIAFNVTRTHGKIIYLLKRRWSYVFFKFLSSLCIIYHNGTKNYIERLCCPLLIWYYSIPKWCRRKFLNCIHLEIKDEPNMHINDWHPDKLVHFLEIWDWLPLHWYQKLHNVHCSFHTWTVSHMHICHHTSSPLTYNAPHVWNPWSPFHLSSNLVAIGQICPSLNLVNYCKVSSLNIIPGIDEI